MGDCCFKHTQTDRNKPYKVPIVDGQTMAMAMHRWLNLAGERAGGIQQTRTVDEKPWPHSGQSCDWGPEWKQYIVNDGFMEQDDILLQRRENANYPMEPRGEVKQGQPRFHRRPFRL